MFILEVLRENSEVRDYFRGFKYKYNKFPQGYGQRLEQRQQKTGKKRWKSEVGMGGRALVSWCCSLSSDAATSPLPPSFRIIGGGVGVGEGLTYTSFPK